MRSMNTSNFQRSLRAVSQGAMNHGQRFVVFNHGWEICAVIPVKEAMALEAILPTKQIDDSVEANHESMALSRPHNFAGVPVDGAPEVFKKAIRDLLVRVSASNRNMLRDLLEQIAEEVDQESPKSGD